MTSCTDKRLGWPWVANQHLIVDYANIFMAKIDDKILKTTELLFQDSDKIKMFKRFLDNR